MALCLSIVMIMLLCPGIWGVNGVLGLRSRCVFEHLLLRRSRSLKTLSWINSDCQINNYKKIMDEHTKARKFERDKWKRATARVSFGPKCSWWTRSCVTFILFHFWAQQMRCLSWIQLDVLLSQPGIRPGQQSALPAAFTAVHWAGVVHSPFLETTLWSEKLAFHN